MQINEHKEEFVETSYGDTFIGQQRNTDEARYSLNAAKKKKKDEDDDDDFEEEEDDDYYNGDEEEDDNPFDIEPTEKDLVDEELPEEDDDLFDEDEDTYK
jgi:hypothetical protein